MTSKPTRLFEIPEPRQAVLDAADGRYAEQLRLHKAHLAKVRRVELKLLTKNLWEQRGKRYEACTLENFQATTQEQRDVLAGIRGYAAKMSERISAGVNILLNGKPGTGKDHLLAGLMHVALAQEKTIKWTSGATLFRRLRDQIGNHQLSEYEVFWQYAKPDVLVISDPACEGCTLTEFQHQNLYGILDSRANNYRPVWVTLNAIDTQAAWRMIGRDNVDRLRGGGLSLPCNWDSYRRPME
jgi:DNA replication protein DnaC